jgi:hypothetical protein
MVDTRHFKETITPSATPATITQPPIIQATYTDAQGHTTTFETDAIGRAYDPANQLLTIAKTGSKINRQ